MGERAGGEKQHLRVRGLDGGADRLADDAALVVIVDGAEGGDRDDLHVVFAAHEMHRDQGSVFEVQRVEVMGERVDTEFGRFLGDGVAQFGIAPVVIGHVADELRKLAGRQQPLEAVVGIDVEARVHQPVGVADHRRVGAEFLGAARDLQMAVNGRLAFALERSFLLGHLECRYMRDLGGQYDFTHLVSSP